MKKCVGEMTAYRCWSKAATANKAKKWLKENNFEHLMGLIDIDYLKNDLADDFLTLADIYTTLDENGVIAYFANENPNLSITDELRTKLNHAIDQLFGLKLLENQEKYSIIDNK